MQVQTLMENTELLGGSIQPLCSFDDSCVYNLTLLAWPSAATLCPDPHEKRRSFHERYAVLCCAVPVDSHSIHSVRTWTRQCHCIVKWYRLCSCIQEYSEVLCHSSLRACATALGSRAQ